MLRHAVLLSLAALLLTGCASLQQRSFSSLGQFEDFQLNDELYRVRYVGNGYTSQSEAEQIALVQAARITVQNGYRYFSVVEDGSVSRVVPQQQPWVAGFGWHGGFGHGFGPGYYHPYNPYHPHGWHLHNRFHGAYFDTWNVMNRVQVNYTIAVSKTKSRQQTQFDAQTILRSLGARYRLNPDGSEMPRGATLTKIQPAS